MVEHPLVEKFIGIVQSCRREKSLSNANRVLILIQENGLETHRVLGNYLIPMLVDCGRTHEAHDLFSKLVHPNEHSWTSLIQACVEHEDFEHALHLFQRMQGESVCVSIYTLQAVLKACAALKCLETGRATHAKIVEHGAENDPFLSSGLVDMYAKCFSCEEARHVLSAHYQDVVAWNALISGYAEHGEGMDALDCLRTFQKKGICASAVTFACCLKVCGDMGAFSTGQELHAEVIKRGYEWGFCVDGTLVYMYSKCGLLAEASHVLSELKIKNVVCWTSLIAGYAEHGYGEEALSCLQQMQVEGVCPNPMTYACCVKGCGNVRTYESTQNLYIEITKKGYDRDPFICNCMLDIYGKRGFLVEACKIFDTLPIRDIFSWNALISGHSQNGLAQEVLHFFDLMHAKGVSANVVTFVFTIKACCATQDVQRAQQLHIEIVKRGLEKDECIEKSLMDIYMKLGAFQVGSRMFYEQIVHDVVSWTSILSGYVEQGSNAEALECLGQMQQEGVSPSAVTYVCCLRACISSQDLITGYKLHMEITMRGLDADPSVVSSVIDMYTMCGGLLEEAQAVFEELNVRDEQAWLALMAAYGEHGCFEHLLRCLEHMELNGACADSSTYFFMLRAHSGPGSSEWGYELHTSIIKKGFEDDVWIASALFGLYGNVLSIIEAEQLLNKSPCRNVVLWTALVTAYTEHGQFEKALGCWETMQLDGVSPNGVTLLCSLKAAGAIGALSSGQTIHAEMMKKGLETESAVGNALVDMYAKCGYLLEAQQHFERLPIKDTISWTAIITGFASTGESKSVFQLLERMGNKEIGADGVTYLSVLLVCSHSGLIFEAIAFFGLIMRQDNVALAFEHFSCMVDLVSRAGQLVNAVLLLEEMPFQPNRVAWTTVLGACRKWQDVVLGRQAFESLKSLDESMAAAFLLMLGIYGNADGECANFVI